MNIRKQQGMSIIGFIIVLSLVVFAAFISMRIVPIYLEYFSVVSAMNGIAAEPGSSRFTVSTLRTKMADRMFVNYTEGNVRREHVTLVRKGGAQFRVAYEVRKDLIGNMDVVATFDRTVQLVN